MRPSSQTTIKADAVLPVCAERARDELSRLFTTGDSYQDILLRVGPSRAAHGITKQVAATLAPPEQRETTYVFTLRWRPVGLIAGAFPTLIAKLGVTTIDEITSLLSIVASYVPPLGALGSTADRAALSRVADATVAALLQRLAREITHVQRPAVGV
jgi:hypothetical protein